MERVIGVFGRSQRQSLGSMEIILTRRVFVLPRRSDLSLAATGIGLDARMMDWFIRRMLAGAGKNALPNLRDY
jgi:hypothetical protein